MSVALAVRWLRLGAAAIHERRTWLTDLDAAIGDGDHGINLDRGFARILAGLDAAEIPLDDPGRLLAASGQIVLGHVGGASGALYGRALIRIGERLTALAAPGSATELESRDHTPVDGRLPQAGRAAPAATLVAVADALDAGVSAIGTLGRSRLGEKTMLDALAPAVVALRRAAETGESLVDGLRAGAGAAEDGARSTIPMLATKGRASYLGERSVGHLDPGAASSALLLATLAEAAEGEGSAAT